MTVILSSDSRFEKAPLASGLPESFKILPAVIHRIKVVILAIEPQGLSRKSCALYKECLVDLVGCIANVAHPSADKVDYGPGLIRVETGISDG